MNWRASTRSGSDGGERVETASDSGTVMIRDTTNRDGFTMSVPAAAWSKFTASL